jgi:hypothetical protein
MLIKIVMLMQLVDKYFDPTRSSTLAPGIKQVLNEFAPLRMRVQTLQPVYRFDIVCELDHVKVLITPV